MHSSIEEMKGMTRKSCYSACIHMICMHTLATYLICRNAGLVIEKGASDRLQDVNKQSMLGFCGSQDISKAIVTYLPERRSMATDTVNLRWRFLVT